MYERVRTGIHIVRTMYQSCYIWTWKESEADRSLMDVRTSCWDVQTDASWNKSFWIQWRVWTERYIVRTDDAGLSGVRTGWHIVWMDGTVDRWVFGRDDTSSGWLTGNLKSSIFFVVQSLLKMLWQVESLFIASLHISDFVQTQNEAKILIVFFCCCCSVASYNLTKPKSAHKLVGREACTSVWIKYQTPHSSQKPLKLHLIAYHWPHLFLFRQISKKSSNKVGPYLSWRPIFQGFPTSPVCLFPPPKIANTITGHHHKGGRVLREASRPRWCHGIQKITQPGISNSSDPIIGGLLFRVILGIIMEFNGW